MILIPSSFPGSATMGVGGLHDNYGSAPAAQPGKSKGGQITTRTLGSSGTSACPPCVLPTPNPGRWTVVDLSMQENTIGASRLCMPDNNRAENTHLPPLNLQPTRFSVGCLIAAFPVDLLRCPKPLRPMPDHVPLDQFEPIDAWLWPRGKP